MYTFKENIDKKTYDNFIKNYPYSCFMQEYNWANVKDNWNSIHCALYKDDKIVGVCSILIKNIFKKICMFYVPRGYLIDFENYDDLSAMTDNIKKLAKKRHAYMVKIDPNFCISEKSFKDNKIALNYSNNYEVKHNNLLKCGYKFTGIHKDFKDNFQPQYNIFAPIIDEDNNILSIDEILKTYKSKFKYYLGSFHEKRGVSFEISNDTKDIDRFIELLRLTEQKQNINLRSKEYFLKLFDNFKDKTYLFFGSLNLKKYLDFLKNNNGKEEEINEVKELLKKQEIITLSCGLLLMPGNDKGIRVSEYLYAGNSPLFAKLNISAGLVFEMIKYSQKEGCHYCNLGGVNGNLSDHLTTFKQKFNSIIMEFAGEYDLATSWLYYPIKLFYPLLLKIYKKLKK